MADQANLVPPERTGLEDPGAHYVETSDSDDHFSDAKSAPVSPEPSSPIPRTRVEKVDNDPSYSGVPGTEAYRKREEDAIPDEIALSATSPGLDQDSSTSGVPSESHTAPQTVVIESAGSTGPHSEEFEERIEEAHRKDALPDVVMHADDTTEASEKGTASPTEAPDSFSANADTDTSAQSMPILSHEAQSSRDEGDEENEDEGDDFDEFEEGAEDEDFDDFEDGFQQAEPTTPVSPHGAPQPAAAPQPTISLPFAVPDFDGLDSDAINDTLDPYLHLLFPPEEYETPELPPVSKDQPVFPTARSASLWSQLVAPPPLSPPDWIRSRIRRLFLVSLGVPVDLDEILPASKQKKLVLPSLSLHPGAASSPRTSTDSRSVTRLKQTDQNASSTSVDSQGKPSSSKRRKGPPTEPELDLVRSKQMCMTTDEALDGMTNEELQTHLRRLAKLEGQAKEALEYWQKRTDEKISDREMFEGVIENLVKHARKVRK